MTTLCRRVGENMSGNDNLENVLVWLRMRVSEWNKVNTVKYKAETWDQDVRKDTESKEAVHQVVKADLL